MLNDRERRRESERRPRRDGKDVEWIEIDDMSNE
jgi:hypothetical protein